MKTIQQGLDNAYKIAGNNAYFGDGFRLGIGFAEYWIPIEEEKFPFDTEVFVKMEDGKHGVGIFTERGVNIVNSHFDFDMPKVTHWRPINHK